MAKKKTATVRVPLSVLMLPDGVTAADVSIKDGLLEIAVEGAAGDLSGSVSLSVSNGQAVQRVVYAPAPGAETESII